MSLRVGISFKLKMWFVIFKFFWIFGFKDGKLKIYICEFLFKVFIFIFRGCKYKGKRKLVRRYRLFCSFFILFKDFRVWL